MSENKKLVLLFLNLLILIAGFGITMYSLNQITDDGRGFGIVTIFIFFIFACDSLFSKILSLKQTMGKTLAQKLDSMV